MRPAVALGFAEARQGVLPASRRRLRIRGRGRLRRVGPPAGWLEERRAVAPGFAASDAGARKAGSSPERRLLERATIGWSRADQARLDAIGYRAWLDEQLGEGALDDGPLEEALARALPALAMSPAQILRRYEGRRAEPIFQLIGAAIYRALYSPRQLFERAVIFWSDHFSIDLFSGFQYLLKPADDREVIRRHALGSFPELLRASARSPAMLAYLTNDSNVKGHPNENYARELMELHTMGADGPFTEADVKEVARCFTGWGFAGRFAGDRLGRFRFEPRDHDDGAKMVLGHRIPAGGGESDGERVLEILAAHPATAEFIAGKLLRYFEGYEPRSSTVAKVAATYTRTGGDVGKMLRTIFKRKRMRRAAPKLKRPFHLMISTLRAVDGELRDARGLIEGLYAAGHLPFAWAAPNGYPDSRGYWSGFLLPRWNFAASLSRRRSGVDVDLSFLDPAASPAEIARQIDWWITDGNLSKVSRIAVEEFLAAAPEIDRKILLDAVGLALSSPEFQDY